MTIEPSDINLDPVLEKMIDRMLPPRPDKDGNMVSATTMERFVVKEKLLPLITMALTPILEQVNKKTGDSIEEEVSSVVIPDDIGGL